MDISFYWIGVIYAILSGCLNNFGTVLQKKVVNDHRDDQEFMKNLVKNKLWLVGLLIQLVFGTVFYILAQIYIGPAIIPGLMAAGLIILAIGSMYIVGETLKKSEICAICIMISGIFLLGLSELAIEVTNFDLIEPSFIIRMTVFTLVLFFGVIFCDISQRKSNNEKLGSLLLAIESGLYFAISNFWIGPLMGTISKVFTGNFRLGELILFIIACVILCVVNFLGILKLQEAFKSGQASNLVPIQQVPIQITPIFIYFHVFLLPPPTIFSVVYMLISVLLIIISSFLLGKRQAQIETIK